MTPGREIRTLTRLAKDLEDIAGPSPTPDKIAEQKRITLSLLCLQLGRWDEALPHLEMLLGQTGGRQPGNMAYLLNLYDFARRRSNAPTDGGDAQELALAARMPSAAILYRECRAALTAGQGNKALYLALNAVIRSAPSCREQLHVLADTLLSLAAGDKTAVRRLSERVLSLRLDAQPAPAAFRWSECCALALGRRIYWNFRAPHLARQAACDESGLETLRSVLQELEPRRAREIGCGSGRVLALLAALGIECLGEDISATALWLARKRKLPGLRLRLRRLCLGVSPAPSGNADNPTERFDLLIFRHAARHMPPQELKQTLAAACPTTKAVYLEEPDLPPGHPDLCCFFRHDYRAALAEQGFRRVQPLAHNAWLFSRGV